MIPAPVPRDRGFATSRDAVSIAWYRYGTGVRTVHFVPTWNIVDARVVGHQVDALRRHATVVTFDPRGAGASDRPEHGYDFSLHAADALAVMDATGIERAAIVTASRAMNSVVLLAAEHPDRLDRIAAVAPYMKLEPDPAPPDPARLAAWRGDWAGFIVPFMHAVFSEPGSDGLIAEMIGIGMEATRTSSSPRSPSSIGRDPRVSLATSPPHAGGPRRGRRGRARLARRAHRRRHS